MTARKRLNVAFLSINLLIVVNLISRAFAGEENLNLRPRQTINEGSSRQIARFRSASSNNGLPTPNELFVLIQQATDENAIIIGARDALYNLSSETLESKYTINWRALGQTVEECHMKGKSESECHNFVRVASRLRNGRILVCGTHAFSPQCREYEMLTNEDRFAEREQYTGQAISPYDPRHNSTFVYDSAENEIFVGTVSDIGANDALLYRKRMHANNGGEILRTPKDDRVIDYPQFVGSFLYKDYVYFWYRERAAESLDNNREPLSYSRVGRICAKDNGGAPPANDRFATFLKARLNCSIPADDRGDAESAPFYFNELQSISAPVDDGSGDALLFGVFHTSRSLLMSAVCAFRMSQVAAIFDHGRFKTQRTPTSLWGPFQKFYSSNVERPGRCVPDTRRLSDVSFITKNPLMYDLVPSEGQRPLLVEGPSRPAITTLSALPQRANAVRNQPHFVVYIGRADGTIGKVVDTSMGQEGVLVENVRAFNTTQRVVALRAITSTSAFKEALVVVTDDEVARLPLHHCSVPRTCMQCVRLRDPHCAWDADNMLCVNKKEWSTGSYIQNILKGVSEQCPDFSSFSDSDNSDTSSFSIDEEPLFSASQQSSILGIQDSEEKRDSSIKDIYTSGLFSKTNLSAVAIIVVLSSVFGFLIGYRISKWRTMGILSRRQDGSGTSSSGGSSACDDYERYGQTNGRSARLSRHNSFSVNPMLVAKAGGGMGLSLAPSENYYVPPHAAAKLSVGSMAATATDTVSLVFNTNNNVAQPTPTTFMPLQMATSMSNGGSGAATPRHEMRSVLLGGNAAVTGGTTLPRDYKVKKVYL